jgi:hypothetical protein
MSSTNTTLLKTVADEIAGSGPKVERILVDTLVDAEVAKRSSLLLTGLEAIKKGQGELNKVKPDVKTVNVAGDGTRAIVESWTPDAIKKFDEATAKQKKLVDAFNTALEKNDGESYGKLADALK